MPDRVDPSRADRHPIHPDRERADSRTRGDISVSPNRDAGRNRSPRPAAVPDRGSEVRNRQSRGERTIRDSGSISPNPDRPVRDSGSVSPNPNRNPGGGRVSRAHADTQSPGDSWRTPGSRAHADIQSPGDSWRLGPHPIVDGPRHRLQEVRLVPAVQVRRRSVLSTIQMIVGTPMLNSRVLHAIVSFAGCARVKTEIVAIVTS